MDIVKLEKEIAKFNESFCGEVSGMTVTQIKDRLAAESLEIQKINIFVDTNEDIKKLKEEYNLAKDRLKEILKPSKEAKKIQNDKVKFLLVKLEEKTIK